MDSLRALGAWVHRLTAADRIDVVVVLVLVTLAALSAVTTISA